MSGIIMDYTLYNARYKKLVFNWWKKQRDVFYRGIREIVSLSAPTCIPRKVVRNITRTEQCVKILPVKFSCMRCDQCTMISQNHIFKICSNIGRVSDIIPRFTVFCQRYLSRVKAVFFYFFTSRSSKHKPLAHFIPDGPVIIDISVVAKANRQLARYGLFVNATYANAGNITQFNRFQEMFLLGKLLNLITCTSSYQYSREVLNDCF